MQLPKGFDVVPTAQIDFDPGMSPAEGALLAKHSNIAIIFGIRVEGEGFDLADLTLPWGKTVAIAAVAAANPNTIVVLETGNPVVMPWQKKMKGIVEAWYPGQAGGQAIAEVLTGKVNPSGHFPITFLWILRKPRDPNCLVWAHRGVRQQPFTHYREGAEVGYRWYAIKNKRPLYLFGYGLSYTSFSYSNFKVERGKTVTASFTVTNTGKMDGVDVLGRRGGCLL